MEEFIFDRTNTDVLLVKQYRDKINRNGFDSLTQAEQTLWRNGMKGAYNYTDYNRVGRCINAIVSDLANAGIVVYATGKTDWTINDTPTASDLTNYLFQIQLLRDVVVVFSDTPATPSDFVAPSYVDANAIEKILYDIERRVLSMIAEVRRSGTFNCGENEVLD